MELSGYEIVEQLGETSHSSVFRARQKGSLETVVIKVLKAQNPTPFEIARFKYEFELIRDNHVPGVVGVLDIIKYDQGLALVMEDFHGVSLSSFVGGELQLETILDIFVRLSEILGQLHEKNIIHKDIKPSNILYNQEHDILRIGDFGIAWEFTGITSEIYNPVVIEGTLPYMAPEQTGRMNCPVDYRTDLYSLGITFYEMLTGSVPFMASDPMELIHAHIARVPVPPHVLNPMVPRAVSGIVMKLLSKTPDDRYQNSFGLMEDLRECLGRLQRDGRIDVFPLGHHDVSRTFTFPQILVGRDRELGVLEDTLERVAEGHVEILLVAGEPGVGKSALVNEMDRLIVDKRGYFISGKYNQYQKQIPYSAVIQAFQALAPQLLAESGERIAAWKKKMMNALGSNGKIITDAIPEMEMIIGKQPDIPELGPEETENRFNLVFKNFISSLSDPYHPLVMFLDDLQWADRASLNLIKAIATDRALSHLFLIGSYRDNEVQDHHPLVLTLDSIRARGARVAVLTLDLLSEDHVTRIVSSFLKCSAEKASPLARITHGKTLGNPFFIHQFLKTLYEEHYLTLDVQKGWVWDDGEILNMQVTDNVVDLMTEKIVRLSETALAAIKVCSCIGDTFDVELVSAVMNLTYARAFRTVDELTRTGLITFYKKIYRFHHDRILEAAYSLIPHGERKQTHFEVGQRLLQMTPPYDTPARSFAIADQFNQAHDLITSEELRYKVARLNLTAGVKAKESTAYDASSDYLKNGMDLLPETCWADQYKLTYDLYKERMESEHLNRNFLESERLFTEINRNAASRKDRAWAYHTLILLYTTMGKINEALDLGIEALKMFGVKLSKNCGKVPAALQLLRFKRNLMKYPIETIPDHFVCTDEDNIAKCELYGAVGLPAYYANPNLFGHIVLKGINDDFKHGLVYTSAFGFISIASILCTELGDFKTAFRLSDMAMKLNKKMDDKRHSAKVHFVYGYLIAYWLKPLSESLEYYDTSFRMGLEIGDFLFSGNAVNAAFGLRTLTGEHIDNLIQDHSKFWEFQKTVKDPFVATQYHIFHIYNLILKGTYADLSQLKTEEGLSYDDVVDLTRKQGNMLGVFVLLIRKELYHFIFLDFDSACEVGFEMDRLIEYPKGSYFLLEHTLFRCLALLAVYPGKSRLEQRQILKIYSSHKRRLKKWLRSGSENVRMKYTIICAEEAAYVKNRPFEAAELYRQALDAARDLGYANMEALVCERAAMFYMSRSFTDVARVYLEYAYKAYERWGILGKMKALEKAYPFLKPQIPAARSLSDSGFSTSSSGRGLNSTLLDLATVMKVSQTISSEILIDRLLDSIMTIAVINAGAQKGFLILPKKGQLVIEAARTEGHYGAGLHRPIHLDHSTGLCSAIVHYAYRCGENVILGHAAKEGEFSADPYIQQNSCKSVLAMPIINKGQIFGVLYMENNLIPNAFTAERLELLKVIATQAAISIENAQLFEMATTDELTRLFAQRYFQLIIEKEIERYNRYKHPFSLVMMDIDNFSDVNDNLGHKTGDEVLKHVAGVIRQNCRVVDFPARYGGEEFAMILPETDVDGAMTVAEKIRAGVESSITVHGPVVLKTTISAGVVSYPRHGKTKEDLLQRVEEALYTSKQLGKNKVTESGMKR